MKHRIVSNLLTTRWALRRAFPDSTLLAIEQAIRKAETRHGGELRFAIETALDVPALLRGVTARDRAVAAFASLRTWDTEANNGVLIYVLLSERDIEIVADRGYNGRVQAPEWEAVCRTMETAFREGRFEDGSLNGIELLSGLITRCFPPAPGQRNELPDKPVLL